MLIFNYQIIYSESIACNKLKACSGRRNRSSTSKLARSKSQTNTSQSNIFLRNSCQPTTWKSSRTIFTLWSPANSIWLLTKIWLSFRFRSCTKNSSSRFCAWQPPPLASEFRPQAHPPLPNDLTLSHLQNQTEKSGALGYHAYVLSSATNSRTLRTSRESGKFSCSSYPKPKYSGWRWRGSSINRCPKKSWASTITWVTRAHPNAW